MTRSAQEGSAMPRTIAVISIAVVCGALAGGMVAAILHDDTDTATAARPTAPVGAQVAQNPEQLYRRDAPGVVVITATSTEQVPSTPFTPPSEEKVQSLGSGFVIDRRGDIVTNDHVVAGATGVRVGFSGGSSYPAKVVGTDASSDLAVLRVDAPASALHPLGFDSSANVQVGEPVYAIGNPFGLDRTLTAGIVSATGRDIQAPDGLTIPDSIQTDAPINHGNSGGPLLDAQGRVVGVTAQIQGGTVDANVGVGFAIPSDAARSVTQQLIAHGHAEHAWLGVEAQTIDPSVTGTVPGLPRHGVLVAKVAPGSPAAKAGLRGDSIVSVDGRRVSTSNQLADAVARLRPDDRVTLVVVRDGASRTVHVTLGAAPQQS
jgi:S1-C subfamily serine protease